MSEKYVFETKDGKTYEFDTEKEMTDFSVDYSLGNLVAEGMGEFIEVDGKQVFRITSKGLQYLKDTTPAPFPDPVN